MELTRTRVLRCTRVGTGARDHRLVSVPPALLLLPTTRAESPTPLAHYAFSGGCRLLPLAAAQHHREAWKAKFF